MFKDEWPEDRNWKGTIALGLVPVVLIGFLGYRLLLTATPVTRADAIELFRAESSSGVDPIEDSSADQRESRARSRTGGRDGRGRAAAGSETVSAPGSQQPSSNKDGGEVVAAPAEQQPSRSAGRSQRDPGRQPGHPKEGVYSWDTEGYESFSGNRRRFPSETQRIVTIDGPTTWTNHHYFSEERQSWWQVHADEDGYVVFYQRNKVVFGPVTRDTTVTFDPPMRVGRAGAEVGDRWSGSWKGKTHGTYEARYFDHTFMTIGGERVEVWGVETFIHLRGEIEGEVHSRTWFSPKHRVPVREHYVQDVQSGPGTYHAEWDMTLKSLDPER